MYKGFPLSIVVIYYEAQTVEIATKQIKKIRDIIHGADNYLVNRHTSICLVANVPGDSNTKEMHNIPSKDSCISDVICSNGYIANEIIDIVIGNKLNVVDQYIRTYKTKIKLLPIQVLAIQYSSAEQLVVPQMFPTYQKHLQISNFTLSHEMDDIRNHKGGFEILREFLNKTFSDTISQSISDAIDKIKDDEGVTKQSFFSLE